WGRGVLDVVVANQNGPLLVYKNKVAPGRQWLQLDLQGTRSNRSAIGAVARVFWTMKGTGRVQEQVQVVSGGNAYASRNMRRLQLPPEEQAGAGTRPGGGWQERKGRSPVALRREADPHRRQARRRPQDRGASEMSPTPPGIIEQPSAPGPVPPPAPPAKAGLS